MPGIRQLVAIVALTAAFAVAAFVVFTAFQQPAPSAVSDVKTDPAKATFVPVPKPLPPPPAPPPPQVFGITPTRRAGNVEGGPVD
ncbi:MAG: hypothetical protein HY553_10300 [Elusimicrobia bacterium]|nr:hypothetical protein [Elusimicrobiota bacterium]